MIDRKLSLGRCYAMHRPRSLLVYNLILVLHGCVGNFQQLLGVCQIAPVRLHQTRVSFDVRTLHWEDPSYARNPTTDSVRKQWDVEADWGGPKSSFTKECIYETFEDLPSHICFNCGYPTVTPSPCHSITRMVFMTVRRLSKR